MEKRFLVTVVFVLGAAVLASYLQSGVTGNPIFRTDRVIDLSSGGVEDSGSENALVGNKFIQGSQQITSVQDKKNIKQKCACEVAGPLTRDNCPTLDLAQCAGQQGNGQCSKKISVASVDGGPPIEKEVSFNCKVIDDFTCGCPSKEEAVRWLREHISSGIKAAGYNEGTNKCFVDGLACGGTCQFTYYYGAGRFGGRAEVPCVKRN